MIEKTGVHVSNETVGHNQEEDFVQAEALAKLSPRAPNMQVVTDIERTLPIEKQIEHYAMSLAVRPAEADEPDGYGYDDNGNYYATKTVDVFLGDTPGITFGEVIDPETHKQMLASDPSFAIFSEETAKLNVMTDLDKATWWSVYNNEDFYTENPFKTSVMSEQIVFGNGTDKLKLHNFTSTLEPETLDLIKEVLDDFAQMTNEQVYAMIPNIVIHESFAKRTFAVSGRYAEPSGRAYGSRDMIELNGRLVYELQELMYLNQEEPGDQEVEAAIEKAKRQLKSTLVHEIGHKVDSYQTGTTGGFQEFFRYDASEDPDDARLVVTPIADVFVTRGEEPVPLFCGNELDDSVPTRNYGHTNAAEDFATAMELLLLAPNNLDKPRSEALLTIMERKFGPAVVPLDRKPTEAQVIPHEDVTYPGIEDLPLPAYIAIHLRAQDIDVEDEGD